MSNQANIRDIQALAELKASFGRFSGELREILPTIQKRFEDIREQLDERERHWQRRADNATQDVYEARLTLNECESQPDDEEGNSPDCSFEQDQVTDAERALAGCEDSLETAKQWRYRIEGLIADFQNDIHRLSVLASARTDSAQGFLEYKIGILTNYIGSNSLAPRTNCTFDGNEVYKNTRLQPIYNSDALHANLSKLGFVKDSITSPKDMVALRKVLKKESPSLASEMIDVIVGGQPTGLLTNANITLVVQEMLDYLPSRLVANLPRLKITLASLGDNEAGAYLRSGNISLNVNDVGSSQDKLKETIFHEMMHWFHLEGPASYRNLVGRHYQDRTMNEDIMHLSGYSIDVVGKKDKWYDPYAGRIYLEAPDVLGIELPTRYIEFLAKSPEWMAEHWNDPTFRETMIVILSGLY